MSFKDYFSNHAKLYAQHRPAYPPALFTYLASLTARTGAVWDCGTGNGQVAIGLAPYFQQIHATDASAAQITHAIAHPQVTYTVSTAEQSPFAPASIDLITVGLALHWFNLEAFYQEVRRVLHPNGAIAVWCYTDVELPTAPPALTQHLAAFRDLIYPYFAPEINYIWQRYETIPFPFQEEPAPQFQITAEWTMTHLIGYLQSLSGTQQYREHHGADALNHLAQAMREVWPETSPPLPVQWPIYLRVGRLTP